MGSVISNEQVIEKILRHLGLWEREVRPPPKANATPQNVDIDYCDSQLPPSEDYLYSDVDYSIENYAS